jgi:hypothetical protein
MLPFDAEIITDMQGETRSASSGSRASSRSPTRSTPRLDARDGDGLMGKHANDEYNDPGLTGPGTTPHVPPDWFETSAAAGAQGKSAADGGVVAGAGAQPDGGASTSEPADLSTDEAIDAATREQLEAEVARLEAAGEPVEVTGTGSNGNVLVGDLQAALHKRVRAQGRRIG